MYRLWTSMVLEREFPAHAFPKTLTLQTLQLHEIQGPVKTRTDCHVNPT
jgi:hypothetical protein